ncbi:hypothetical protein RJ639_007455 [Escallonia herrerae]|uniref:Uncharacterized protein n=1 Tax=Escallonia herrerae TaxID=1293975 RepID=A0AA88VYZ0_9ASTE|nr:hypothetical protein RJ639_007455 [Escallonia herrerae]
MGALQMVNAIMLKSEEKATKGKYSKKRWGLLYATVDIAGKTQEVLVDTGANHNFMSLRVARWLGLKPTKDGSWFKAMHAKERPTKGVFKTWTRKADINNIDMDELGMDFMEKSSATLNTYCGVLMMAGKEGQPEWMILLVSKDEATTNVFPLPTAHLPGTQNQVLEDDFVWIYVNATWKQDRSVRLKLPLKDPFLSIALSPGGKSINTQLLSKQVQKQQLMCMP